jgi:uncharacterized protein (TIGR03790 family)
LKLKWVCLLALAGRLLSVHAVAYDLTPSRLGVIFNVDDPESGRVAEYYAAQRAIPPPNVIGIRLPLVDVMSPDDFRPIRNRLIDALPSEVQSLVLVWSKPYAVGCMSVTSAFAAGYRDEFCRPGCGATAPNPLFDSRGWLPADTVGWWPAMLLPSDDWGLAQALIRRGVESDSSAPPGTLYLMRTNDSARNVRAATYQNVELVLEPRMRIVERNASMQARPIPDAIGYFIGSATVAELPQIRFRPGAIADHLTSTGGILAGGSQMSALAWLHQGATASYGSVSEPCNHLEKFPNLAVLFDHYLHGDTALEAYWKSVAMPGQGLFIGEPLSRPYATRR